MISKEEQNQHLIDMMKGDEELGLYESWGNDAEKESNLSDLNDRANAFWLGYRTGIKTKERMYSEKEVYSILEQAMKDCYRYELEEHYSGDYRNLKEWFETFKNKQDEKR
jgi:hypothetical protein